MQLSPARNGPGRIPAPCVGGNGRQDLWGIQEGIYTTRVDLTPMPPGGDSPETPSDPVVEEYKKHIDRTLLRANLRRTVAERLANLVALQRFAEELRRAGRAARRAR